MSKHIFISYSRKDVDMMRQVDKALRMKGIKTWTDEQLVPGTSQWKAAIERGLEEASAVVVLMSPDAKSSEWIDRELEYARMRQMAIIPLLVRGDPVSSVPFELVSSQWISLLTEDQYAKGIEQLAKTLFDKLGLKAKTKYQLLHDELAEFAAKLPVLSWVGVISVDGLTEGFYSKTDRIEEDRVGAMSAASISLSERISSELGLGTSRFTLIDGQDGTVFTIGLSDDRVLMFALEQCPSIDTVISAVRDNVHPLLEVLDISQSPFTNSH
jgi:predicted regulator of Ras-like GTPase activity (Roadblock/LC7/MglB family)